MHRSLERQLKRMSLSTESPPENLEQWLNFLRSIEGIYNQYEIEQQLLERSLTISSQEMGSKIKENKKMSIKLAQAGKLASLGTLASGVAHELNNPLAIIHGYLEHFKMEDGLDERKLTMLSKIKKAVDRMAETIKHLLKLSRQTRGDEDTYVDVETCIEDCLELMKQQFEFDNIFVELDFAKFNSVVEGSSSQWIGTFQNLLVNSRDAFLSKDLKQNNKIKISTNYMEETQEVIVTYKDNAGGVTNEVLEQLFDPFFTTKDVGKGTGLGLSISKQIVEELKGSMDVASIEGEGLIFTITVPAHFDDSHEVSAIGVFVNNSFKKIVPKKIKVLIVDDEEDLCELLQIHLDAYFDTKILSNSTEALKLIQTEKFDLLITDLRMPKVSGEELALEFRKLQPGSDVVVISGHIVKEMPAKLQAIGDFLFIEKPFSFSKAVEEIMAYVQRSG